MNISQIRERNYCAMKLWWRFLLLLLVSAVVRSLEQVTHNPRNNIFCPKGLLNCRLNHTNPLRAHDADCGPARVCSLTVKPKLCCYGENCNPCLWINIQLVFIPDEEDKENEEGSVYDDENGGHWDSGRTPPTDDSTEGQREYPPCEDQLGHQGKPAAVTICYTSAGRLPTFCKKIEFIMTSATSYKPFNLTLVDYEDVDFGTKMKITVRSSSQSTEAEFPTINTVCSSTQHKHIKECKGPRVKYIIDRERGVVKLDNVDDASNLDLCMKRGKQGKCFHLPSNIIPLELITDCTCFQAWKEGSTRSEFCPFEQHPDLKKNVLRNLSVSVDHTKTYDGQPVLDWNLSAPCRLRAELWPCRVESEGTCREIPGFRQQCSNETYWEENVTALWASGKFVNIDSCNHQQLCVMLQVDGRISQYYCQHSLGRHYWSLLIPLAFIIVCLTIFGIVLLVNKLKSWISGWERQCQDTRGQVLLLHSSATEHQAQLVCKLGQMFSELGFSVFLDLWNHTELSSMGPAPWFHSKLSHIQQHGGKVLLMLSPTTLQSAECYWNVSKRGKEEIHRSSATYSSSDVLRAALGCISADRQKGGAAQRYILVHLGNHEHLINEEGDMPKLFRGLPLYKLPSQTQGLLMELCLESQNSLSGKLKKMWWTKRAQSKLAQGLQKVCHEKRSRTESVLTQEDSLSLNMEEMEERVYLKKEQF